jgi:hypothetical protein
VAEPEAMVVAASKLTREGEKSMLRNRCSDTAKFGYKGVV